MYLGASARKTKCEARQRHARDHGPHPEKYTEKEPVLSGVRSELEARVVVLRESAL